jgi:PKD repeat protein
VIDITSKYAKSLLPILLILLFTGTASALPTATHDIIKGETYVSSTANWDSHYSTNNFSIPNGIVVFARYYVGVWGASSPLNSISTKFNGHAFPTNPAYYATGMGVTWIPYDVIDYVHPGEMNTAIIDTASWGDGRQYGSTLVVVLKNESKPLIEYWIADGLDWMHYGEYGDLTDVPNSSTYFNGTVDLSYIQNASLYSTHLTGFNYEDLNGHSLPSAAEYIGGEYFDYIRWDNIQGSLLPENQTVLVSRGNDTYCAVGFHALLITYNEIVDLLPVSLTPTYVVPNTSNTLTAIIENKGKKDSTAFNVSLLVNGAVMDTQRVSELASGGNTTVDFNLTPDGTADSYTLTVVVDSENAVNEKDETNNILEVLIGTAKESVPIAEFTANITSGAAPFPVHFADASANIPTEWLWDFGDGTTSTEQNPTHIYTNGGTYNVKLTATNAGGSDTEEKANYVMAYITPFVDFTASITKGKAPITVTFTDQSGNSPTEWLWDFGDGTSSTEQNPSHLYTTLGTYTVTFKATNIAGSNSTIKTGYITITPATDPIWTATSTWNTPSMGNWKYCAAPTAADLDGDGDYDLLIGTSDGKIFAYENTGTTSNPLWTRKTAWDVPDIGDSAAPYLVDLDRDGDYDLMIGSSKGITYGYENTGTINGPVWTKKTSWDAPDIGSRSTPCLADLDGDGDYDLLIGATDGITYAYENSGAITSPVWTAKTEWLVPSIGIYSTPCLADLDGDGDYDLLIGEYSGITYGYENTGSASSSVWTRKSSWDAPDVGSTVHPALVDLDRDGDCDLLIGGYDSVSFAYENTVEVSNVDLIPIAANPLSNVTVNNPCTINATVINNGTSNVGAFVSSLSANGVVVDTQTVSGPAAGSSSAVNLTWTPKVTGDYNLTVTADPNNGIVESDETNNALTITVTVSAAPTGPDTTKPVINSAVLFPANATAGSKISISVNATDNKEVTEVAAGNVTLVKDSNGIWQGSITAPSSVGSYSLLINASDAAGNVAETSAPYNVVQLSGSSSIAVSPKISSVTAGSNASPTIIVKNAQSIDDTFKVWISVSELPVASQANLSWVDWTEKSIKLRAGEEVSIPVKVDVQTGTATGLKLFRANVKSETTGIGGFNTGYLKIV